MRFAIFVLLIGCGSGVSVPPMGDSASPIGDAGPEVVDPVMVVGSVDCSTFVPRCDDGVLGCLGADSECTVGAMPTCSRDGAMCGLDTPVCLSERCR